MTEKEIVEKIAEVRREKRMSQRKLAAKVGISATYLSMIERGKAIPTLGRFMQLCEGLGVKPHRILESQNKNPAREEILMNIVQELPPQDMELLVVIASTLRDRNYLR